MTNRTPDNIQEVYEYWKSELGFDRKKLTKERALKIGTRLETYSVAELKRVVDVVKTDPFWRGQNNRNKPYDDIVNIFRNDTRVEQFLERGASRHSPDLFASPDNTEQIGF